MGCPAELRCFRTGFCAIRVCPKIGYPVIQCIISILEVWFVSATFEGMLLGYSKQLRMKYSARSVRGFAQKPRGGGAFSGEQAEVLISKLFELFVRAHGNNMLVSWNRGSPKSSTYSWDFPWNKSSRNGGTHLWKPPICELRRQHVGSCGSTSVRDTWDTKVSGGVQTANSREGSQAFAMRASGVSFDRCLIAGSLDPQIRCSISVHHPSRWSTTKLWAKTHGFLHWLQFPRRRHSPERSRRRSREKSQAKLGEDVAFVGRFCGKVWI